MINGWLKKPLGDVCDVIGGGTPSKSNSGFYEGDIPWATVRDMKQDIITHTEFQITEDAVKNSSTNIIPRDNVIIATRVGLGKICFLHRDTAINQDLRGIVPKNTEQLSVDYLFWWFKNIAHKIITEGTGATVQGVKLPFIKSLLIPLPSIEEQKQIVAILDEAFAGIDQAIANTEKNLASARELFESRLNSTIEKARKRAKTQPIADLCIKKRAITYGVIKLGEHQPDGVPCLRTSNVRWLKIESNEVKRISPTLSQDYSRTILNGGEVLVNVRGTLGGVAVVPPEMTGWNVSREVAVVPCDQTKINSDYLAFCIGAKSSQDWLTGVLKGAAYTGINLEDLRTLKVPLLPIDEQININQDLVCILNDCRKLEVNNYLKLKALNELKQSLLQKAFSGELTADDVREEAAA